MLKITMEDGPGTTTLRLEGRVEGPWVKELRQAWNSLDGALGSKKLSVDLRGVTHMCTEGKDVLAEIHRKTGAELIADTPMTKYFAEEAKRRSGKATKEGA